MGKQCSFQISGVVLCLIYIFTGGGAAKEPQKHQNHKLFVFGDSYADTGNWGKSAISWKLPYGITFPGNPTGRFSDGRILTDYLATYLGINSPVAYQQRETANRDDAQYGMNFAYGGSGVFDTSNKAPNLANQINLFQHFLLEENAYTKQDLNSSIAFVSVAGNDYQTFLHNNGDFMKMSNFTTSLIDQLSINLKRIQDLGVQNVAITSLPPIGCFPQLAASSSYQNCSQSLNAVAEFHNDMLQKTVQRMNKQSIQHVFQVLDLYSAFTTTFEEVSRAGNKSPLQPCCRGITSDYWCGDTDKDGAKKYEICNNLELSVFWDTVHPCQNGWHQIFLALRPSLMKTSFEKKIINNNTLL